MEQITKKEITMKKINLLTLYIIICINFTWCQSTIKEKVNKCIDSSFNLSNEYCDSLGQIIINNYFRKNLAVDRMLTEINVALSEYNKKRFHEDGNHVGNNCFELEKVIKAYNFSILFNFPKDNVDRIIRLLSITDSIVLNDFTPVTQLYMSINQSLTQNDFEKILNHLVASKHADNSVDYYIIYSKYSLPEENIIEMLEKLIPKYRNCIPYGHMINYLLVYSNHPRRNKLLEIEYNWMKTDSTFLKSKISGMLQSIETKLNIQK